MIPAIATVGSFIGTSPLEQAAPTGGLETKPAPGGDGFTRVFDKVGAVIDDLKAGEAAAISGLQGQSSTQNVVESVMKAEHSLQTAISIRDKLVSAYQSISQMTI